VKTFLYFLCVAFLFSCQYSYTLIKDPEVKFIDYSSAAEDSSLSSTIYPYKHKLDAEMNLVVGYLNESMEKGYPEGKLGNLVSDILFEKATTEYQLEPSRSFCLINNGGLRTALPQGEITRGKLFELMPFENTLALVELKGTDLLKGLANYILLKKGQPVSHNVRLEYREGKLMEFTIGGKQVDSMETYTLVTSDYLSGGGDNMEFMKKAVSVKIYETKLRETLINYFKVNSSVERPLKTSINGRIKINS